MSKMSKTKGSTYERHIAKKLGDWWGEKFQRTPASGGLDWGKDNRVCGDIVTPPDSSFPFTVECKKRESWNMDALFKGSKEITKWWKQVKKDCLKSGLEPMLVMSRNLQPDYVVIRRKAWEALHAFDDGTFIQFEQRLLINLDDDQVVVMSLDHFIKFYTPDFIVATFKQFDVS